jgi:hypothetical protein
MRKERRFDFIMCVILWDGKGNFKGSGYSHTKNQLYHLVEMVNMHVFFSYNFEQNPSLRCLLPLLGLSNINGSNLG